MINIISPAYHKNYSHYCGLWDGGLYKGRDWGVCGEYQLCRSQLVSDPSSQRKIETMHQQVISLRTFPEDCKKSKSGDKPEFGKWK